MTSEKSRAISANDMHVLMTQCLDAARSIHIAMCLFDDGHAAQKHLNEALHSALGGAEQCRQLHQSKLRRFIVDEDCPDDRTAGLTTKAR